VQQLLLPAVARALTQVPHKRPHSKQIKKQQPLRALRPIHALHHAQHLADAQPPHAL
jgi:hypothetical protein